MVVFEAVLPALVLLLVVAAVMERLLRWAFGLKRDGRSIASAGFEELNVVYQGTNRSELEQREAEEIRRDDETQGAPPTRIDLASGTAVIRPRAGDLR